MPSYILLRRFLLTLLLVSAVVILFTTIPPRSGLPARDLAQEVFELTGSPEDLPQTVRVALAREIGQTNLHMAAAGRPFNDSDVVSDGSLPYHRLVIAAVGSKHVIVHFEEGGFSPHSRVVVFQRGFWRAYAVWSTMGMGTLGDPAEFLAAIKSGALWGASAPGAVQ